MDAYGRATATRRACVVLNFTGLEYMNSSGIGLLVTLLVRANRNRQRLLAYGLTDHYRQIFELTRLDEAIGIHDDEAARAGRGRRLREERRHEPSQPEQRRAAHGRKPVERLEVTGVEPGARRHQRRRQAADRRRSRASARCGRRPTACALRGRRRRPRSEVIAVWKQRLPGVLAEGQPLLRAADRHRSRARSRCSTWRMPGGMKLSTGVLVLYADDESFTLMTPQGHMFAGWITFSAFEDGRRDVRPGAGADARVRPALRDGHDLGGHKQEDRFWEHTLRRWPQRSASRAEVDAEVGVRRPQPPVVATRRNVWHNAGIRSGDLHDHRALPVRAKPFRRG